MLMTARFVVTFYAKYFSEIPKDDGGGGFECSVLATAGALFTQVGGAIEARVGCVYWSLDNRVEVNRPNRGTITAVVQYRPRRKCVLTTLCIVLYVLLLSTRWVLYSE